MIKNKRTLVVTGTTNIIRSPEEIDKTMEEIFYLTLPSKERYVKKYGYDLLALRSFGSDKHGVFKDKDVGFLRAIRTFEMLEYYDVVMWIDADAIITNDTYKIEDFLSEPAHTFYASGCWSGKNYIQTGNFIFQKTERLQEFLNIFYQAGPMFSNEQELINALYRGSPLQNTIKVIPSHFLNDVPAEIQNTEFWLGGRPPIKNIWSKNSFQAHLTGVSNIDRYKILTTTLKDYL